MSEIADDLMQSVFGNWQSALGQFGVTIAPTTETTPEQSRPRSTMRGRGRSADTIALGKAAHDVLAASSWAMTLRQLYYALIPHALPKTEAAYGKLKRVMRDLREDGTIPWGWLVDHTRSVFQPRTFDGIEGLLADTAKLYRRDLMRTQDVAIQVWAESDSIGSVIAQTADRYCIPTFIGRGYSARGYLWSAAVDAVAAHEAGKDVHILHVGDHDPSGEDIYRDVVDTLRLYALTAWWASRARLGRPGSVSAVRRTIWYNANLRWREGWYADEHSGRRLELEGETRWLSFDRLALTAGQIAEYGLPYRPVKVTDVRSAKFTGEGAVEVEALPVDALLGIVEDAILDLIDPDALAAAELAEQSERDIARRIAGTSVDKLLAAGS